MKYQFSIGDRLFYLAIFVGYTFLSQYALTNRFTDPGMLLQTEAVFDWAILALGIWFSTWGISYLNRRLERKKQLAGPTDNQEAQ